MSNVMCVRFLFVCGLRGSVEFKQVVAINSFQGPWKRGHIHQSNGSLYMNEIIEIQNSKFFVQGQQNHQIKYAIFTYLS